MGGEEDLQAATPPEGSAAREVEPHHQLTGDHKVRCRTRGILHRAKRANAVGVRLAELAWRHLLAMARGCQQGGGLGEATLGFTWSPPHPARGRTSDDSEPISYMCIGYNWLGIRCRCSVGVEHCNQGLLYKGTKGSQKRLDES